MPQILLSALKAHGFATAPAFHLALEAYRQALLAHRFTEGEPAPVPAAPFMEAFIRRVQAEGEPDDFVLDGEVLDDTPLPPTLAERKVALMREVERREGEAISAIMPPGKMRLWQMDYARACNTPAPARTPEQEQCIAQHEARQAKVEALCYHAARLCAEIEDLTDGTLDRWQPQPFPAASRTQG